MGVITIIKILKDIQITNDFISDVIKNNSYNEKIINYYHRLQKEDEISMSNKIKSIEECNQIWILDKYEEQKVKDFKKTNLCKDKFCNNCKKVKQASRMTQFIPILDELEKEYDLFHVVLTVPNLEEHDCFKLSAKIKKMFDSYRKLNHYLLNIKKIRDVDFTKYGYIGSLRSLEISYQNNNYHPHLHCIFVLKKGLKLTKKYKNVFSKSRKNGLRKFSELEILIQKIWYLTNNDIKVTKKSIQDLELGYSCMIDKVEQQHYFEVFKYMTKSNSDENEFITYDNFKVLYYALKNVRQIQGYGILYNIKEDLNLENIVDNFYNAVIEELQKKENPLECLETPEEVLNNNSNYIVISRKKIFSYLRTL